MIKKKIKKIIKNMTMTYKKLSILIMIILCVMVLFFCFLKLYKNFHELNESNNSNDNLINDTIEINPVTKEIVGIDWNYLKSINEDIIAWIEIEGTNINYPVLKDKDIYYLNHSFDKKYNSNGSIFTTNTMPFDDLETIIYGHNTKLGNMFSDLSNYWNKDYLDIHKKIKIYTPYCDYEASIFSVYSIGIETESNNIKLLNFNERINYYKKASKYNIENKSAINKIVKLSTCSYINAKSRPTEQRYYIIANLIPIL